MGRTARASLGGFVCHVLNRGNGRSDVFHKDDDYSAFVRLMQEAHEHVPMQLVDYCPLTNHFHVTPFSNADWHPSNCRSGSRFDCRFQGLTGRSALEIAEIFNSSAC